MANNPFVDGITNVAIPDSPLGVYLSGHKIKGTLFGIDAVVGKSANMEGTKVKNSVLKYMHIEEYGHFKGMSVWNDANFEGMEIFEDAHFEKMWVGNRVLFDLTRILGFAYFGELHARYASFSRTRIGKSTYFKGTRVGEAYFDGTIFEADADFTDARILKINTKKHEGIFNTEKYNGILIVHGCLNLEAMVVKEFTGIIVANRISGTPRKIPKSMQEAIEKAEELYATMKSRLEHAEQ